MTKWYLGTMGFSYKSWVGPFYPDGLGQSPAPHLLRRTLQRPGNRFHLLRHAARLRSQRWHEDHPARFCDLSQDAARITHDAAAGWADRTTAEFLARMRLLGDKLGPILIQFPPDFTMAEVGALIRFLPLLPPRSALRPGIPAPFVGTARRRQCYWRSTTWPGCRRLHPLDVPQSSLTTDFLYLALLGATRPFSR